MSQTPQIGHKTLDAEGRRPRDRLPVTDTPKEGSTMAAPKDGVTSIAVAEAAPSS